MIRLLTGLIILSAGVYAQTLSITAPASGTPTISGIAYNFRSSCSSCPSEYSVEYFVNDDSIGVAFAQNAYQLTWNTNNIGNGTQAVTAIARDAANVTIATSSAVSFVVANTMTYTDGSGTYNVQISVTPSCTSNCSGAITFTLNATGSWTTSEGWAWAAYVDGEPVTFSPGGSASSPSTSALIDTRNFYDGSHNVKITLVQNGPQFLGEWQQAITFQNGSGVQVALNANYREIFLTPSGSRGNCAGGSTCTLSATLYNADGSTVSSPTLLYYSLSPSVATVGQSTGVVTIASGVTLPNSTEIGIMSSVTSGTFQIDGTVIMLGPFQQSYTGQIFEITGGTGCNTGFYVFAGAGATSANVSTLTPLGTNGSVCNYSTGPSRLIWAFANAANTLPHFSRNGSALTSYSSTASMWHASMFDYDFTDVESTPFGVGPGFYGHYAQAWNTLEVTLTDCMPGSVWNGPTYGSLNPGSCATSTTSQTAWQTDVNNYVSSLATLGSTYGLYYHLIGTSWFNGDPAMFPTTQGLGATFTTPAVQYAYSQWASQNSCAPSASNLCYGSAVGDTRDDEADTAWNVKPLAGAIKFGTNGLTQIVASSGACTATQTNWALYYENGNHIIISGATTSGFNSVSPNVYQATNASTNSFTFPCASVANGTYNSTTDPNLILQQFGYAWHTGGATANYVLYNAFSTIMSWIHAAGSSAPLGIFTPAGVSSVSAVAAWENAAIAGYNELYCISSNSRLNYGPAQISIFPIINDMGDTCARTYAAAIQDGLPLIMGNAGAPTTDYAFGGANFTISSATNGLVTLTSAHNTPNVFPGVTRVQISGSSNAAYNGNFLIQSTPTATSLNIYGATAIVSTSATATITFSNGHAYAVSIQSQSSPMTQKINVNDVTYACAVPKNRGLTFTISGTGTAWNNSGTYYYPFNNDTDASCNETSLGLNFFLVPSGTSTGGTASIIATNLPTRGISIMSGFTGPRAEYASHVEAAITGPGTAGTRTYLGGTNPQAFNAATGQFSALSVAYNGRYNDYSDYAAGNTVQQGPLYYINVGGSTDAWYAIGQQNIMANRMTKYLLQPHLASPDYGQGYEAAARAGSYGNLLLIQSFWNASRSLTVNLSPYLQSGQKILKYYCTYLGCALTILNSGTSSDTVSFDSAGTVWYVFSNNEAGELAQPSLSVDLADISNATQVVIRYSYEPYPMNNPQGNGLMNAINIGSGYGPLPIDRNIGPIYYRILFLATNGELLATSDIQQF